MNYPPEDKALVVVTPLERTRVVELLKDELARDERAAYGIATRDLPGRASSATRARAVGTDLGVFRSWREAWAVLLVLACGLLVLALLGLMLWSIGEQVGHGNLWKPLGAFLAGYFVQRMVDR